MSEARAADRGGPAMLEVRDLYVGYYKDLHILQGVNLIARRAKITTVLGANGVGKSTLLKAIYGFLTPASGEVRLADRILSGTPTHQRIRMGLSFITQQPSVFSWMTVEENLELGGWTFRGDKARLKSKLEENYQRFPALRERRRSNAGELSGGQQRMVELGRTLMTEPKVILVDEPTAGLAKMLTAEVYRLLANLRDHEGITIVLVDQEIRQALKIADFVYVLELGRDKFGGPVEEFTDLEKTFWVRHVSLDTFQRQAAYAESRSPRSDGGRHPRQSHPCRRNGRGCSRPGWAGNAGSRSPWAPGLARPYGLSLPLLRLGLEPSMAGARRRRLRVRSPRSSGSSRRHDAFRAMDRGSRLE